MLELDPNCNSVILKNEKLTKRYIIFITINMLIIISLLVISTNLTYRKKYSVTGIVKDNKINLYLTDQELSNLLKENYIYIEKKRYKINSINALEPLIEQNVIYYNVILDINSKKLINNKVLTLNIYLDKRSIFKEIVKVMKGV